MYNVNDVVVSGMRIKNLFSHQDEKWHSTYIRPVKGLYSMSKVQDMEPGVDSTIIFFFEKLRERFIRPSKICEMSDYINFCERETIFLLDIADCLTFSRLGCNESGHLLQGPWNLRSWK